MADLENLIGKTVQGWTLTRVLGSGADGVVYAAEQAGKEAAVKILFKDNLSKPAWEGAQERLELQLALVGRKHHENLVEILGGGPDEDLGTLVLIMELVPGTSMDKLAGKIPLEAVPSLIAQLCAAARHLESIDLVHRDIKPANIVISDDFSHLTLLDLGIAHQVVPDAGGDRLSGKEFVATTRYSPPEFVWRTEQAAEDGAWRSVTFYQIGATMHDMIVGKPIFTGFDTPRACLYDAVRERTPVFEENGVPGWLIQVAESCLLKDWRQRLELVEWDSFSQTEERVEPFPQEKRIRLKQLRNHEMRQAEEKMASKVLLQTREQELWQLNNALVSELRNYIRNSTIFPRYSLSETVPDQRTYVTLISFESDATRGFPGNLEIRFDVSVDSEIPQATNVTFVASLPGKELASLSWTEMFNPETAFDRCRRALLDAIEAIS